MDFPEAAEVGRVLQDQVAKLAATNDAINSAILENSKKIKEAETELKACKDALSKIREEGEAIEARVNDCSAKGEECNDELSQLENRVGEILEGNQTLKAQIEGVGLQVQQLQQSLPQALHQVVQQEIRGLQGWLDGKLDYLFPNITIAAPTISYMSGPPVGVEDTTSF